MITFEYNMRAIEYQLYEVQIRSKIAIRKAQTLIRDMEGEYLPISN